MKRGRIQLKNHKHFSHKIGKLAIVACFWCVAGCISNPFKSPRDPENEDNARKAEEELKATNERASVASEMASLTEAVGASLDRLHNDAAFDMPDLKALQSNVDRAILLLNQHPEIANGRAVEFGSFLIDLRAFLEGVRIGTLAVDARTGAQTGQRIQNGDEIRLDVLDGEWTSKLGSGDWPPNPGTGYPNYRPSIFSDHRACTDAAMGALVGFSGKKCLQAGTNQVYEGLPDLLTFRMNDAFPDDNGGMLTVRWRLFTKPAPDASKFRFE